MSSKNDSKINIENLTESEEIPKIKKNKKKKRLKKKTKKIYQLPYHLILQIILLQIHKKSLPLP